MTDQCKTFDKRDLYKVPTITINRGITAALDFLPVDCPQGIPMVTMVIPKTCIDPLDDSIVLSLTKCELKQITKLFEGVS